MKGHSLYLKQQMVVLVCLLTLVATNLAMIDVTKDYIVNGGFEPIIVRGPDESMMGFPGAPPGRRVGTVNLQDEPAGWFRAWRPDKAIDLKMELDSSETHTGECSAKIACTGLKELVCNNWAQRLVNFPKGVSLQLLGWVKTRDVEKDTVVICIQCWDKDNNMIGFGTTQQEYQFEGTRDWSQVGAETFVPENTENIYVRCVLAGKGMAWFDDVSLKVASPMLDVSPDKILLPEATEKLKPAAAPAGSQRAASPFARYIDRKDEFIKKLAQIKKECQQEEPTCRVDLEVMVEEDQGLVLSGEVSFTPLRKIRDLNWVWSYINVKCLPDKQSTDLIEKLTQVIEEVKAEYEKKDPGLVCRLKPMLNTTWAGCGSFRIVGQVSNPELLQVLDTRLHEKELIQHIIYGSTYYGLTTCGYVVKVAPEKPASAP